MSNERTLLDILCERLETIEKGLSDLSDHVSSLDTEADEADTEAEELMSEIARLTSDGKYMQAHYAEAVSKLHEQRTKISQLQEANKVLCDRELAQDADYKVLVDQLRGAEAINGMYSSEITKLKSQAEKSNTDFHERCIEVNNLKRRLADYENIEIMNNSLEATIKILHQQRMKPNEHIDFVLHPRYFQYPSSSPNGMDRDKCLTVLMESFGGSQRYWNEYMRRNSNTGFHIVCRPDQFARFIVRRNQIGKCVNGIRDLDPKYRPNRSKISPYNVADVVDNH